MARLQLICIAELKLCIVVWLLQKADFNKSSAIIFIARLQNVAGECRKAGLGSEQEFLARITAWTNAVVFAVGNS